MIKHEKVKMTFDVDAVAPIVVSASRSTDIPAFYSEWLIDRIRCGYCVWINPFNQKPMYISFDKSRVFVFWTKNPKPLIRYLDEIDDRGLGYYFQFTLNNYENEGFEPNLPKLSDRIDTFKFLSNKIGSDRVIWRFDPIILAEKLSTHDILKKIWTLGNGLKGYTKKLVFSFVDVAVYKKVQRNLQAIKYFQTGKVAKIAEANEKQIDEICEGLLKFKEIWHRQGWDLTRTTCSEQVDLARYGIEHNKCIDDALLRKCFSKDDELMFFLNQTREKTLRQKNKRNGQNNLLQGTNIISGQKDFLKDSGQRKDCGCILSKDIGMYNTCMHLCSYCYANSNKYIVMKNFEKYKKAVEKGLHYESIFPLCKDIDK